MSYIPGIKDEAFIRGEVPMTKREIRALTICSAMIGDRERILDVGAGTGSLSIEAALAAPLGEVVSVEKKPASIELIKKNAAKFGTTNIKVVEGAAPEAFSDIEGTFDVILIGGSGGALEKILDYAAAHLKEGGRIVLNAITLQNAARAISYFRAHGIAYEATLVQASRLRRAGSADMMLAQNPVYIILAHR